MCHAKDPGMYLQGQGQKVIVTILHVVDIVQGITHFVIYQWILK